MAITVVSSVDNNNLVTAGAGPFNIQISYLTDIQVGDLFIVFARMGGAGRVLSFPAGWTDLYRAAPDGSTDPIVYAYHRVDGTEGYGDPAVVSVSWTGGTSKMCATAIHIRGAENPSTQAPQLSTAATGTLNSFTPNSVSPGTSKEYCFILVGSWDGTVFDDTAPTGYNSLKVEADTASGGALATNCRVASSYKIATATSESPGAWSLTGNVNAGWTAHTIAVHPEGVVGVKRMLASLGVGR